MSDGAPSPLPADPHAAIELLQAELAETNREVMLLTLEMDQRVDERTAELRVAQQQLEGTNAELVKLALELEERVQDRTQALRESEDRYRLAAEVLAKEARRKDEFLALLGHELRNPLAPIRTAIHVLKSTGRRDPTTDRMHDMIARQVAHLARLVDDLLDVSRIATGKIRLQKEPIDLVHLVRLTTEDHRAGLESAGLTLSVQAPDGPLWVKGDPTRLSEIVGNLLNNARKFTDASGQVTVQLAVEGDCGVLTVSDTGIGIEPEVLPTLFEPFSQSERSRSRSGGLGLGLALVRGLAELHDGSIKAASEGIGKGARFTVTLPLMSAVAERAMAPSPALAGPSQRRILIVEDNSDAAIALALFLEGAGHLVAQAPDVVTALLRAREFHPEIILSDIGLPGELTGYDLAAAVTADPGFGRPYLIAITGFGQEEDKRRAREAGFAVHLVKPVDPHTLERVLARVPARGVEP